MRRLSALASMCAIMVVAAGCSVLGVVKGSGNLITRSYDLSGFSRVSASSTFHVEITQADSFSVSVTMDDNMPDYVEVAKEGDTLELGLKLGYSFTTANLTAVVTMPRLDGLTLSGASRGVVSGFGSSVSFSLNVSGASQATLAGMTADDLSIDVSGASRVNGDIAAKGPATIKATGASTVTLGGKAKDITLECSGASSANLATFPVGNAQVNISGASSATWSPSGKLSGDISGASHLYYLGAPTLGDINTSGGSSVSQK